MDIDKSYEETAKLVQQTLSGNASAYDALVKAHFGAVRAIALSRLQADDDSVDELVQEVLLRAWLHLSTLSHPERFAGWVAQITRNLASDWKRRQRTKSAYLQLINVDSVEQENFPSDAPSPHDQLIFSNDKKALKTALNLIPSEQRELLLLHYSENVPQAQIARLMSIHPSTVMRKLNLATDALRKEHGQALEKLSAFRTSRHSLEKASAIMAIAWGLSQSSREALAASTSLGLVEPSLSGAAILKKAVAGPIVKVAIFIGVTSIVFTVIFFELGGSGASESSRSLAGDEHSRSLMNEADNSSIDLVSKVGRSQVKERTLLRNVLHQKDTGTTYSNQSTEKDYIKSSENGDFLEEISECVSENRLESILLSVERLANSATYNFYTSQTVFGRTPAENYIADREGTSTITNGAYRIQHRLINPPRGKDRGIETITSNVSDETVLVESPNVSPRHFTAKNRHTFTDTYDPLKALLRPPFGKGPMSDFLRNERLEDDIWTTCTVARNGSRYVYFGGSDWTIRLNPSYAYFPDYVKSGSGSDKLILEKEVTSFGSFNGIPYPREFAIRSFMTDAGGNFNDFKSTTASVKMLYMPATALPYRANYQSDLTSTDTEISTGKTSTKSTESKRESDHRKRILEILKDGH